MLLLLYHSIDCFGQNIGSVYDELAKMHASSRFEDATELLKGLVYKDSSNSVNYFNLIYFYNKQMLYDSSNVILTYIENNFMDSIQNQLNNTMDNISSFYFYKIEVLYFTNKYDEAFEVMEKITNDSFPNFEPNRHWVKFFVDDEYYNNPDKISLEVLELIYTFGPKTSCLKLRLSKEYWKNHRYFKSIDYYLRSKCFKIIGR